MKGSLYSHPRIVWLILLFIIVSGINALNLMPRLEDPYMTSRIVQITTYYPGADAERVEAEVTERLERKIREVSEVKILRSISRPNLAFMTVELEDSVTDPEPVTSKLRDKIAEITDFPQGVLAPIFDDKAMHAHAAVIALTWESDTPINYAILGRHAKELESQLRNLHATDFVNISGLPQEEIRVSLDDKKLAAHGLSVSEIAAYIRHSDARGSAGSIDGGKDSLTIEVTDALDTLTGLRRIPLTTDAKGAALRLGDLATIKREHQYPPTELAYFNGKFGVSVSARMQQDYRVDHWSVEVGGLVEDFRVTLPASIKIERIFNQADYANERLSNLMGNLAIGAFVVIAILLVSLGLRAALISASILPLTLLAALAIMNALDMRIQQVMVTGMIVALGIMVDNAIVITDEIQQRLLGGQRRVEAVAKTVRKLWLPLLGSTVTTIIAFMPLLLMPGNAGDFLLGIPAAVIAALISSYIIAFTIISAMAGRVIRGNKSALEFQLSDSHKRIWWRDGIDAPIISGLFKRSLEWSVDHPVRSIIVAMMIPMLGFYAASRLTEQFFPISDRDQFRVTVSLPAQASILETRDTILKIHDLVIAKEGVLSAHWHMGGRIPKFFYNMLSTKKGVPSYGESMITASSATIIPTLIPELQTELNYAFPEANILVRELGTGPPIQAPLEIRVAGPDLATLEDLGNQVRSILAGIPEVTRTNVSLAAGRPQIMVNTNKDDVAMTGLSPKQIADQLNALTKGVVATYITEETQQIPLRLILNNDNRGTIANIADMNLRAGKMIKESDNSYKDIPLSALGNVYLGAKVGIIQRRDAERINTVQGFLKFGILPETVFLEAQKRLKEANLIIPDGYRIEFGGENAERSRAMSQLFGTAGILLVIMLIILVLTFNSFRLALVTLLAAVQAAGLGFLSLWLGNFPLTFVVIIGLMGLIGLAINATIVILSELRGIQAAREGDKDAVVHGVMKTGRHIISTTLTTVGGFMPLILSGGKFWPPFAVAIAGGAFLSMIVSFYFAPAAFLWLTKYKEISNPNK